MSLHRALLPLASEKHGLVTPADALAAGGTRMALVMLARRGVLERLAYGIYRVTDLAGDPLEQHQEALLRFPSGVLSHATALDLHQLCDINPATIHVTVPRRVRIRVEVPRWLTLHRGDLGDDDVTWHDGLAIVTPARAIIDGIEANAGARFVDEAVETARRQNLLTTREQQAVEKALLIQRLRRSSQVTD